MATRAAWIASKRKHDQREFATVKPKQQKLGEDTVWVSKFVADIAEVPSTETLHVSHPFVIALLPGLDEHGVELKLRKLASMGILRMKVERDSLGAFVRYAWTIVDAAR